MRDGAEALLGNELTRESVDTVGLVLNAHEGGFKTRDELLLTVGHCHQFLFRLGKATLFECFVGGRRIVDIIAVLVHNLTHHGIVVAASQTEFLVDDGLELFKFLI